MSSSSSLSWAKYACSMIANDTHFSSRSPSIVRLKETQGEGQTSPWVPVVLIVQVWLCLSQFVHAFVPIRLSFTNVTLSTVLFSSVAQLCVTLCYPMDCSTPGFPVHHQLTELTQTHVHWVSDAIQPSHPLSSPSPSTFNLSQFQGLFQWVSSSHQVAKILDFQLQHQSFQWIFRTDFL